jgi:predicted transposase YdaD
MTTPFIEKYINPFTDYGFKRLFGEEANKDLLLDFLNELLREEQGEIKDITLFNREQLMQYENSIKYYRDLKNSFDTARQEGEAKGKAEGKKEEKLAIAKVMLAEGFAVDIISKITGLTEAAIKS